MSPPESPERSLPRSQIRQLAASDRAALVALMRDDCDFFSESMTVLGLLQTSWSRIGGRGS